MMVNIVSALKRLPKDYGINGFPLPALLLKRANKVMGVFLVSTGGIVGTVADPKLIFATALKSAACGIILAHNDPSGDLQTSEAVIDVTKKLQVGCKFLEIQMGLYGLSSVLNQRHNLHFVILFNKCRSINSQVVVKRNYFSPNIPSLYPNPNPSQGLFA